MLLIDYLADESLRIRRELKGLCRFRQRITRVGLSFKIRLPLPQLGVGFGQPKDRDSLRGCADPPLVIFAQGMVDDDQQKARKFHMLFLKLSKRLQVVARKAPGAHITSLSRSVPTLLQKDTEIDGIVTNPHMAS